MKNPLYTVIISLAFVLIGTLFVPSVARSEDAANTKSLWDFIMEQTQPMEEDASEDVVEATLYCELANPEAATDELLAQTWDALSERLTASRFSDAQVQLVDGEIAVTVAVPEDDLYADVAALSDLIKAEGQLEFRDLEGTIFMDESALADVEICNTADYTHYAVSITLTPYGAEIFAEQTEANIGKQISIFLDGKLISAPTVTAAVTGNTFIMAGSAMDSLVESFNWAIDLAVMMQARLLPLALVVTDAL